MQDLTRRMSLVSELPQFCTEMRLSPLRDLTVAYSMAGVESRDRSDPRARGITPGLAAAGLAVGRLLDEDDFPAHLLAGLTWRRDPLGRPFIGWSGPAAECAAKRKRVPAHLHVSNTHDGGAHIVVAAYSEHLAGIGIDAVWLPRLRRAGKDGAYLLRFARQFMSTDEWSQFVLADGTAAARLHGGHHDGAPQSAANPAFDPDELLRHRVAAHFSLMEAASKACGTGLRMGVGMGRDTSLPKQSLGVQRLEPPIELMFGPEAVRRLEALGAVHYEACVHVGPEFLISAVALYRAAPAKREKEAGGIRRRG